MEDAENLNRRRREMGMMPVETYKELILSTAGKKAEKQDKRRKMESVQNGLQAPNEYLLDRNGGTVSLADFSDKLLVIDFWASWCSPCLQEAPKFMELAGKYKNEEVNFITVSIDDPFSFWKEFTEENNWTGNQYWLGREEENPLFSFMYAEAEAADSSKLILIALPTYVFISAEGKIINKQAAPPSSAEFENELKQYLSREKATAARIL